MGTVGVVSITTHLPTYAREAVFTFYYASNSHTCSDNMAISFTLEGTTNIERISRQVGQTGSFNDNFVLPIGNGLLSYNVQNTLCPLTPGILILTGYR